MNLIELVSKLKNKTISFNSRGHNFNPKHILIYLEAVIKSSYDFIYNELKIGYPIISIGKNDIYCSNCDIYMCMILLDENTIAVMDINVYNKLYNENNNIVITPELIKLCDGEFLQQYRKMISKINVPSGQLMFTNNFYSKELYIDINKNQNNKSLKSLLGRFELMTYLANNKNVGYGQMSGNNEYYHIWYIENKTISIYVNNEGNEIIIGGEYIFNPNSGRKYKINIDGFVHVGKIHLTLDRWMCSDIENLKNQKEILPDDDLLIVKDNIESNNLKEYVVVNVKPGIWGIEHYYDFIENSSDIIYSKLYLKEC
jgi:hypothetical protein